MYWQFGVQLVSVVRTWLSIYGKLIRGMRFVQYIWGCPLFGGSVLLILWTDLMSSVAFSVSHCAVW